MPVRVNCPHCHTPCLVAEQHLGVPVQCGRCGRAFTTRAEPAVRLDIGAAATPGRAGQRDEHRYLVQHLVSSNLDERRELAVLAVVGGMGGAAASDRASALVIRLIAAALALRLNGALSGTNKDAGYIAEPIASALREANRAVWDVAQKEADCKDMRATAAVVVVWDGQVHVGHAGTCRVHHQHAGQLTQITRDQTHAVGEASQLDPASYQLKLAAGDWLIAGGGLHTHLDTQVLQEEIAKAPPWAAELAQQLVERAACTAVVVRCY